MVNQSVTLNIPVMAVKTKNITGLTWNVEVKSSLAFSFEYTASTAAY